MPLFNASILRRNCSGLLKTALAVSTVLSCTSPAAGAETPSGQTRIPSDQSGKFIHEPSQGRFLEDVQPDAPWPPEIDPNPPKTRCSAPLTGSKQTFNVGPGHPYKELTDVPWLTLMAGDVVNIFHRPEPYRTKFGLRAQGTARAPVIINGVTDSKCNRPEISGANAVTANDMVQNKFGAPIEPLGLIQIYRNPNDPDGSYTARHIRIQNLKLTGTHFRNTFYNTAGVQTPWNRFAAAIYAVRVSHLTVENCEITGNNQGVFTNSRGMHANDFSSYVFIRRNKIHLNGTGAWTEHNVYIQAYRALYEGNEIGAVAGGSGSSIKDRSSGTVIRYNHITSGARAIDLVEAEEEYSDNLQKDPLYNTAWVYGNIIINDIDNKSYSARLFHWGFDNNSSRSRAGTLHFFNNTVINRSPQERAWYTTLFHMNKGVPDSILVEARSNIFANYGTTEFQFLTESGKLAFRGTNIVPQGWKLGQPGLKAIIDRQGAELIPLADPMLNISTWRPEKGSPAVAQERTGKEQSSPTNPLVANFQYRADTGWAPRKLSSAHPVTLGALDPAQ